MGGMAESGRKHALSRFTRETFHKKRGGGKGRDIHDIHQRRGVSRSVTFSLTDFGADSSGGSFWACSGKADIS